jgi:hypothetical protein
VTFSSPTAASSAAELQSFMVVLEEIRASMAVNLGSPYNTNPSLISFTNIRSGSVIVGGQCDTTGTVATDAYNKVGNIGAGSYSGFTPQDVTYVANGFNPSTASSSVNLPLILGITIPVVILFIVVGAIVFVKLRAKGNSIKEVEKVEQVQVPAGDKPETNAYQQMEHEDTANNLKPELKKEMNSTNNEAFS